MPPPSLNLNFQETGSEARGSDLQSQHLHRDHHRAVSQRQADSNNLGNFTNISGGR